MYVRKFRRKNETGFSKPVVSFQELGMSSNCLGSPAARTPPRFHGDKPPPSLVPLGNEVRFGSVSGRFSNVRLEFRAGVTTNPV